MKDYGKKAGGVLLGIAVPKSAPLASGPSPKKAIGSAPPAAPDPSEEMGMVAAGEFMAAIRSGDASSAWSAFKSMKEACDLGYSEEE